MSKQESRKKTGSNQQVSKKLSSQLKGSQLSQQSMPRLSHQSVIKSSIQDQDEGNFDNYTPMRNSPDQNSQKQETENRQEQNLAAPLQVNPRNSQQSMPDSIHFQEDNEAPSFVENKLGGSALAISRQDDREQIHQEKINDLGAASMGKPSKNKITLDGEDVESPPEQSSQRISGTIVKETSNSLEPSVLEYEQNSRNNVLHEINSHRTDTAEGIRDSNGTPQVLLQQSNDIHKSSFVVQADALDSSSPDLKGSKLERHGINSIAQESVKEEIEIQSDSQNTAGENQDHVTDLVISSQASPDKPGLIEQSMGSLMTNDEKTPIRPELSSNFSSPMKQQLMSAQKLQEVSVSKIQGFADGNIQQDQQLKLLESLQQHEQLKQDVARQQNLSQQRASTLSQQRGLTGASKLSNMQEQRQMTGTSKLSGQYQQYQSHIPVAQTMLQMPVYQDPMDIKQDAAHQEQAAFMAMQMQRRDQLAAANGMQLQNISNRGSVQHSQIPSTKPPASYRQTPYVAGSAEQSSRFMQPGVGQNPLGDGYYQEQPFSIREMNPNNTFGSDEVQDSFINDDADPVDFSGLNELRRQNMELRSQAFQLIRQINQQVPRAVKLQKEVEKRALEVVAQSQKNKLEFEHSTKQLVKRNEILAQKQRELHGAQSNVKSIKKQIEHMYEVFKTDELYEQMIQAQNQIKAQKKALKVLAVENQSLKKLLTEQNSQLQQGEREIQKIEELEFLKDQVQQIQQQTRSLQAKSKQEEKKLRERHEAIIETQQRCRNMQDIVKNMNKSEIDPRNRRAQDAADSSANESSSRNQITEDKLMQADEKYQELIFKKEENELMHKQKVTDMQQDIDQEEEELADLEALATANQKESRRLDIEIANMKRKGFYVVETIDEAVKGPKHGPSSRVSVRGNLRPRDLSLEDEEDERSIKRARNMVNASIDSARALGRREMPGPSSARNGALYASIDIHKSSPTNSGYLKRKVPLNLHTSRNQGASAVGQNNSSGLYRDIMARKNKIPSMGVRNQVQNSGVSRSVVASNTRSLLGEDRKKVNNYTKVRPQHLPALSEINTAEIGLPKINQQRKYKPMRQDERDDHHSGLSIKDYEKEYTKRR